MARKTTAVRSMWIQRINYTEGCETNIVNSFDFAPEELLEIADVLERTALIHFAERAELLKEQNYVTQKS